ncbi:MAG: NADP-dependent isocitrate dehydrogenase [Anaerolineaceae bacterium]|nr:NADP-dependent isocitrate dehydrogenase [Anaerolineaceae bacterium]
MKTAPSTRTIPFIPGDGIGPEIMDAAQKVINASVQHAYGSSKRIDWKVFQAGQTAFDTVGTWLPTSTIEAIRQFQVGIKGPLTTPVGGGIRSLNVSLRQKLDLFVCLRPVRWFEGLPSPHRSPQGIDVVIFRENIEDLYAGIEYQAGTPQHAQWMQAYRDAMPKDYEKLPYPQECGIGIKPISKPNSQRLVHAALKWAVDNHRRRVTLVHKGNIMKYTEGAFRNWGYEEAENSFNSLAFTRRQYQSLIKEVGQKEAEQTKKKAFADGKIWVDDVIADVVFEQLITKPQNFDVIAVTNLNGDYLSDAAAALAGGVGISPSANINFTNGTALFEANHGSALDIAKMNTANPSSLILSAEMMLRYIGWPEAAKLVRKGLTESIRHKKVTFDLAAQIEGSTALGTREFADTIISYMKT